jgi:ABC-type nitrate/sulfonate/bicarbonate transport system ATPase subunit
MEGRVSIRHVSKAFTSGKEQNFAQVLSDISLEIESGSFTSIIGPSGCGKSTLLRGISGFLKPDSGAILVDGETVEGPGVEKGFMFQDHVLFPWLTIYDNIAFGLRAQGTYEKRKADVDSMIELTGLKGYEKHYPSEVSGGMQQRASLARALIGHPKILLLDEPLGALDAFTRMAIQDEIKKIWKREHMTMVMVTHDLEEAVYMAESVVVMSSHPGKIIGRVPIHLKSPIDRESEEFARYKANILRLLNQGNPDLLEEDASI